MQGTCSGSTKEEHVSFSLWQLAAEHLWGIRGQGPGMQLTACTVSLSHENLFIRFARAWVHLELLY